MELRNNPVVVVAVYGPIDEAPASEKDKFYDELTRLLDCIIMRKEIFLMGDINGRTGSRASCNTALWGGHRKNTEQINTCPGNTIANKAWKTLKSMRTQNKNRSGLNLMSMKEWTDHFENLFKEDREEFMSSNDRAQEDTNRHMTLVEQPEISTEDVTVALSNIKNGKALGIGYIHVELPKAASNGMLDVLTQPFNECYEIFVLKDLIEKKLGRGRAVYLIFIALQKAYDTISLGNLWDSMLKSGVGQTYVRSLSRECIVTKGLRQGCSLAPTLFKMFLQKSYPHRRGNFI
ncbi:hypothetical protein HHI36_009129 [Cryptolaemus montrouzieri]|uniref:Reverse transcriptase domain-containing protein n=1 Tax=Cryptolaemus montrouzieri TaxID=559131 RepID=A0ABD2MVA4_9CUCU